MMAPRINDVLSTGTPAYCSACFRQDSSKHYVDFDAAVDRGYGEQNVAMDDLIVCEDCLRAGAVLVGMCDAREFEEDLRGLRLAVDRERKRADRSDEYASKLEDAIDARPVAVSPGRAPRRRGHPPQED